MCRLYVYIISVLFVVTNAQASPDLKIIFNSDGYFVWETSQGSQQVWLDNIFGPLENTAVDAIFWNDGSGNNTANYQSQVLELTGARIGKIDPWLVNLFNQNIDPPQLVIDRAHSLGLKVFYSYRLNDIHDNLLPRELPTFKINHPDWLLGSDNDPFPNALNFEVDAVRQLKLAAISEIITKYNFDGIEIDFFRSTPYFQKDKIAQNAHLLTQLLADIKQVTNQKNYPFYIAARVTETLEGATKNGFDLNSWVSLGLVDYLIFGSGHMPIIKDFTNLKNLGNLKIIAGLYPYSIGAGRTDAFSFYPQSYILGQADNLMRQGADGVYLFNFFPHAQIPALANILNWQADKLGVDKQLIDKLFQDGNSKIFSTRTGWPINQSPGPEYANTGLDPQLPIELQSEQKINLEIEATLPTSKEIIFSALCALRFNNITELDDLEIWFNQKRVVRGLIRQEYQDRAFTSQFALNQNSKWISFPIELVSINSGINNLEIKSKSATTILNAEIHLQTKQELNLASGLLLKEDFLNNTGNTVDRFGHANQAFSVDKAAIAKSYQYKSRISDFTYSTWLRVGKKNQWQTIIDLDNDQQLLGLENNKIAAYGRCGYFHSKKNLGSKWNHLVWSVRGRISRIYLNAKLIDRNSSCKPSSKLIKSINLGDGIKSKRHPSELLYGELDDVRIYQRALSKSEVENLYQIQNQTPQIAPQISLNFDSSISSDTNLQLDITQKNISYAQDRFGISQKSVSFDGNQSFISLKDQTNGFHQIGNSTFSVWFKPTDLNSWRTIFDLDNGQQLLAHNHSNLVIWGRCGVVQVPNVVTTQWQHVAWAIKDQDYQLFLNGQKILQGSNCRQQISAQSINLGANILIDRFADLPLEREVFLGQLDDFNYFNRNLNQSEIVQLYQTGHIQNEIIEVPKLDQVRPAALDRAKLKIKYIKSLSQIKSKIYQANGSVAGFKVSLLLNGKIVKSAFVDNLGQASFKINKNGNYQLIVTNKSKILIKSTSKYWEIGSS